MLRLGIGLVLVGLVAAAHATQPDDEDYFVPTLDLLTTQFAHSGITFIPAYQLSASVVLTRTSDTASIGSGFGSTSQFPSIASPRREFIWATNSTWQQTRDGDHISLSHLFRVEFNEEQVNIAVRAHSVLINRERFKIKLQPHSTSILWSKAF